MEDSELGFSLWLDFVERDFLKNDFEALLKQNIIKGATSNPAIFASAITSSSAYKEQLATLRDKSPKEKYEVLAIEDITLAARKLRHIYEEGRGGYISIEVDPFLSDDLAGTVAEAQRLFTAINEPNVMIKVPATEAGYGAMTELLSRGISVNATLVFSPDQAQKCLDAIRHGLQQAEQNGRVDAVISVFVSRFDRLLDPLLEAHGITPSRTGILNAAKIYALIEQGQLPSVRTLFASTGVKGDGLSADYYIRELLAAHSVNTAPLATIEAYAKEPKPIPKLPVSADEIDGYFELIASKGIDMDEVYGRLIREGLEAFENSFGEMLKSIQ